MIPFRLVTRWLLLAFVITVFCGMLEWAVQQNYRMTANDPQIQMAEDAALALSNGAQPAFIVGNVKIDIAKSLSPFLIIYNASGQVLASSGILDKQAPQLPAGVYSFVAKHGEDRITWQPKVGIREAAIIVPVTGQHAAAFVVAARNLREVEKRESVLMAGLTLGWAFLLVGTFAFLWIFNRYKEQMMANAPHE